LNPKEVHAVMTEQPEKAPPQLETTDQTLPDSAPADGAAAPSAALGYHPLANLFPLLEGTDYDEFKASIQASKERPEVWLYEGQILDGRNRYRACRELGLEPGFRTWEGPGSPLDFVLRANLHRRHLTSSQRAALAAQVEKLFAEEAKQRQRHHGGTAPGRQAATLPEKIPGVSSGEARVKAALVLGTNPRYVTEAKRLQEEDPHTFAEVKAGKKNLSQVKRERQPVSTAKRPITIGASRQEPPAELPPEALEDGHGPTAEPIPQAVAAPTPLAPFTRVLTLGRELAKALPEAFGAPAVGKWNEEAFRKNVRKKVKATVHARAGTFGGQTVFLHQLTELLVELARNLQGLGSSVKAKSPTTKGTLALAGAAETATPA
jgi:hypothetical protein